MMPVVGKKMEHEELTFLRGLLPDLRKQDLANAQAEALLDHADWLQAELDRHIKIAQAKPDKHGIYVETVRSTRSSIGWEIVVTDPKGNAVREVDLALQYIGLLANVAAHFESRHTMRVVLAAVVRSLDSVGAATPERIIAALEENAALDARSSRPKRESRKRQNEELLRGENEGLRAVIAQQEKALKAALAHDDQVGGVSVERAR